MEASIVTFPANDSAQLTSVKSREDYNMLLRNKDFTSNYTSQQLDDWQYDDWSGISAALQQSILNLFTAGGDPLADFDRDVAPQLLAALRQYIQDGISLGFTNGPSSAAGVSPLMSMSMSGDIEEKRYLNAETHAHIHAATTNIMKAARSIHTALSSLGSGSPARRFNDLAGTPVYGQASDRSIFEEKAEDDEARELIGILGESLEVQNSLRELKTLRESNVTENPFVANVDRALAAFLEKRR